MISGTFETHITVMDHDAEGLAIFAEKYGVTFLYIELDRGATRFQPMLTLHGAGTLREQRSMVDKWCEWLRAAGMSPVRTKIEATPWSEGVPERDSDALREPESRYFEHHIKLRLPSASVAALLTVTDLVAPHGARLSRNARRKDTGGTEVRFVNQRCHRVGRLSASHRLHQLLDDLRSAGQDIVSVEQEYVAYDSHLDLDHGWLDQQPVRRDSWEDRRETRARTERPGAAGYPATYQPLAKGRGVTQRGAFDPALKQYENAYTAGEPVFRDAAAGGRWQQARRAAMAHLLAVIAGTRWAEHLVLRGSVTMAAWVGDAAREPGDLDFVVTPATMPADSAQGRELLADIVAAVLDAPGAGLRPEQTAHSEIWTYERAEGRRLVIPFSAADTPDGTVQIDFVFGEELPIPPEPIEVLGTVVWAATAELSLAWKLQWLATDSYPQGKDLYDAVLLAEHTTVDFGLVRELMREELGAAADRFTAETVFSWDGIDWPNFADVCPGIEGTAEQWLRRLAVGLDRR
ncbi:nucleotidyl transferase AbiEii/AbiGii toxin family protein [Actinoplanes sp. GCM10030250]|uniref:nucleotidyl transferase AbiEii/AbiGii toxin family protein n=1 Tax=Actinoplanes sp. GCM10030250 TaxID=3273376 RepID=UPI00361B37E9